MKEKATDHSDTCDDTGAKILAEQIGLIFRHATLVCLVSMVNGSILAYVVFPYIATLHVAVWYAALVVLTLVRCTFIYQYRRSDRVFVEIEAWKRKYLIGTGISGIIWGSSAVVLFPDGPAGVQSFVIIMLAGMTAASVSVLAARFEAFLLYVIPAILPLIGQLLYQGDRISTIMAVLMVIFLIGIIHAAKNAYQSILSTLQLRYENHELLEEMAYRRQIEEELFQEKERLLTTLLSLSEGVVISNLDTNIEFMNPAAEYITGFDNDKARGQALFNILTCRDENSGEITDSATHKCMQSLLRSRKIVLLLGSGLEEQFIEEIATPLKDQQGDFAGVVTVLKDVTTQRRRYLQLTYQASHDALTQLPNRALLLDRLDHAIARAKREQSLIAILFIDLDHFKAINDTMGHETGDMLLIAVADRLLKVVREQDTVARLGGDEYIIILEKLSDPKQIPEIVKKIHEIMTSPFGIKQFQISVTISLGITVFPRDGESPGALLKKADVAMYNSKKKGGNQVQFYVDINNH